MTDENYIPRSTRDVIDEGVWMALKNSGKPGDEIVRAALGSVRAELIAVVGRPGAVLLLRNLANAIEAEDAGT